jgi:LPXTG-motif cell wall-anchored protein
VKRIALILAVTVCALALPASALAQSAGDNQYQDPLAGPNSGGSGSSGSSGSSGGGSSGSSAPAPSQGSSGSSGTAGSSASSAGTAGSGTNAQALPRTGGHPEALALAGLVLLGGGLALRRTGAGSRA